MTTKDKVYKQAWGALKDSFLSTKKTGWGKLEVLAEMDRVLMQTMESYFDD